jgi:hypothetical protein
MALGKKEGQWLNSPREEKRKDVKLDYDENGQTISIVPNHRTGCDELANSNYC